MIDLLTINFWIIVIGVLLFVAFAEILFYLAQQDKKIPYWIIYILPSAGVLVANIMTIFESINVFQIFFSVAIIIFILFVGQTLYEQAGNRERRWYYLTLIFPILAFVYEFTQKRRR